MCMRVHMYVYLCIRLLKSVLNMYMYMVVENIMLCVCQA